jgi:serine/threonine protein kinase
MSKSSGDVVGQIINGYKFLKSIGEGKFSFVYRAENESKVPFAIKKIKVFH